LNTVWQILVSNLAETFSHFCSHSILLLVVRTAGFWCLLIIAASLKEIGNNNTFTFALALFSNGLKCRFIWRALITYLVLCWTWQHHETFMRMNPVFKSPFLHHVGMMCRKNDQHRHRTGTLAVVWFQNENVSKIAFCFSILISYSTYW